MAQLDQSDIIEIIERNIGRMGDDDGYVRIADEVIARMDGWLSIHEFLPPENQVNPANSVQVLWCDAESDFPEYAQRVGTFWYENPKRQIGRTNAMFDSGSAGAAYVVDPMTNKKRDLYWKLLGPLPNTVQR
jgi:hypothetical protein